MPVHHGKIVVVVKGYPRLSETFIAQELLGLERAGFQLHIVSMRRPTDQVVHPVHRQISAPVLYLPEYLYHAPLRVIRSLVRARRLPGFRRAFSAWLADLRRDFSASRFRRFGQAAVLAIEMPVGARWLYAHFIHTPAAVTRYAGLMTGLPWSCSAHAKDIWTSPDWELRNNLASASWVVTCTKAGHERLAKLAAGRDHVKLVYHGLDFQRFDAPVVAPSRRDGTNASEPVRLLAVGRLVEKKGFDVLLNALAQLPADLHWQLTHIGGGHLSRQLQKQARKLGIASRITWCGPQTQSVVLETYRGADIFVLPCRPASNGDRDGLPNVLMEAQSQRLACISTPVGGVPEVIRDGETGLLVPPNDSVRLAEALMKLIRDPDLRNQLGSAAEQHVRAHFDMHRGLQTLLRLFEEALAGPSEQCILEGSQ